jgi:hypothetical protein
VKAVGGPLPTAGASDITPTAATSCDPRKGKLIAYTIEWGRSHASTSVPSSLSGDAEGHERVSAGLLAVCLRAMRR